MKLLRKFALKILKETAFDTHIKHHFFGNKFIINTYYHKGYWYHGSKREKNNTKIFQEWIKPGQYVLEIGGHIGYFSTLFANLVGETGRVDIFEPGKKNLSYLMKNINFLPSKLQSIVTVIDKGAGDINGTLNFYIDPITGQNNSFVKNFNGFFVNRQKSGEPNAELQTEKVQVTTLDSYFVNQQNFPDFVKVDVEGFEWNVIQGFKKTIEEKRPSFMIEIQADNEKIINYFKDLNYTIYNDRLEEISSYEEYLAKKTHNIFFSYNG